MLCSFDGRWEAFIPFPVGRAAGLPRRNQTRASMTARAARCGQGHTRRFPPRRPAPTSRKVILPYKYRNPVRTSEATSLCPGLQGQLQGHKLAELSGLSVDAYVSVASPLQLPTLQQSSSSRLLRYWRSSHFRDYRAARRVNAHLRLVLLAGDERIGMRLAILNHGTLPPAPLMLPQ